MRNTTYAMESLQMADNVYLVTVSNSLGHVWKLQVDFQVYELIRIMVLNSNKDNS